MRRGMGKGRGKGYKNIIGRDPVVHRQSAKGMKQPQKIGRGTMVMSKYTNAKGQVLSTNPFVVKYKYRGKIMARISKPEFWKKTNLKDTDGDKVPDVIDCQPKNPKKQDEEYTQEYAVSGDTPYTFATDTDEDNEVEIEETKAEVLVPQALTDKKPLTLSQRIKAYGVKGLNYVKELNRKAQEDKENFDKEVANLSDNQIRELAVRYKGDESFFGDSKNPYEDELVRREQEKKRLNERLAEARTKKAEKGFFEDLF